MTPEKRIAELTTNLNFHSRQYYVSDNPIIADAEYDAMMIVLKTLEAKYPEFIQPDSPTQRVGDKPLDEFKKIKRDIPMLSLDNAFTADDFLAFDASIRKHIPKTPLYTMEPKYDGLAVEITYKNGVLSSASTRGDGTEGEDVTFNIKTIRNVPLQIKTKNIPEISIRGEVVIFKKDFEKANASRIAEGKQPFANPRNAASGSLKKLDPQETAKRPLRFMAYGIVGAEDDLLPKDQLEILSLLNNEFDFEATYDPELFTADQIVMFFESLIKTRHNFPFEIDGMVFKLNDLAAQKKLGENSHAPRWAIAWKFPAEQKTTKLLDIIIQVGRHGTLTPVAILTPVQVGGTMVSRATLHNFYELARKDIRIGDYVFVQRAGDVIPQIVKSIPEKRTGHEKVFEFPKNCPACGSKVKDNGLSTHYCANPFCSAKLNARICHLVSKDAFDIEGFGDKLVDQVIEAGFVKIPSDIFLLAEKQLASLDRMGEKSAKKIYNMIQKKKKIPFDRFLYSLGCQHLGRSVSKILAENYESILALEFLTSPLDLTKFEGIGEEISAAIFEFFISPENREYVETFMDRNVEIIYPEKKKAASGNLTGFKFVITGTLSRPRAEIENLITSAGGAISGSVSAKTDYLVAGTSAGSKLAKAEKLGVKVIDETALMKMAA